MPRLSKLLEKLEDRIANRWGRWYERNKARVPLYAVLGALGWYFYGMLLNSLKLGKESVFHMSGEEVESIWVLNPFRNLFVVLTPFGLGVTAVIFLLICLITKKGYSWFSGYHFTRDPRGFDILPDGTHGTSGFAKKKELAEHLELGTAQEVTGMLLGRIKERPDDPDKYSTYVAHRMKPGENNNILCIGAPGSYKSRGFIIPFLINSNFNLHCFIDSNVWGYSDELLEKLNSRYSNKRPNSNGGYLYDHQSCINASKHVDTMLTIALHKMINRCECVILLNTGNAISRMKKYEDLQRDTTFSPWIYSELICSSLIQQRRPERHSSQGMQGTQNFDAVNESLQIAYEVPTKHLLPLDPKTLSAWKAAYVGNKLHPLDVLYSSSSQIPLTQVRHYIHLTNSCRTLHFPRNLKPNMP